MKTKTRFDHLPKNEQETIIQQAKQMYCVEELSAKKIANTLGCNIKSIYSWRNKYGWIKQSSLCTIQLSREAYKVLISEINQITDENLRFSILTKLMGGQKL